MIEQEFDTHPAQTIGDLVNEAQARYPDSIYCGGFRLTYLGECEIPDLGRVPRFVIAKDAE